MNVRLTAQNVLIVTVMVVLLSALAGASATLFGYFLGKSNSPDVAFVERNLEAIGVTPSSILSLGPVSFMPTGNNLTLHSALVLTGSEFRVRYPGGIWVDDVDSYIQRGRLTPAEVEQGCVRNKIGRSLCSNVGSGNLLFAGELDFDISGVAEKAPNWGK